MCQSRMVLFKFFLRRGTLLNFGSHSTLPIHFFFPHVVCALVFCLVHVCICKVRLDVFMFILFVFQLMIACVILLSLAGQVLHLGFNIFKVGMFIVTLSATLYFSYKYYEFIGKINE